jgi:hypothetical protein
VVTKWLHLSELGGNPWVLLIWTAVHKAIAANRVTPITSEMSELAVHVSGRLNVLPRVIERLNDEVASLLDAVKLYKPANVFTVNAEGIAISIDNNLKYRLIVDIDSLLFEVNSCAELMGTFFGLLHTHAGRPIPPNKLTEALRDALSGQGVGGGWFKMLDRNRNFVVHAGTPYLAVDISDNAAWELLVMKENIRQFVDPEKYFRFSELRDIVDGFADATGALQAHLVALYQ